jgi:hypothetical protein
MPTNNSWNSRNPAQVERGGTGRDTLADHGLLVGSGVNPVNTIVYAGGANGIPLVSVAGADPNFGVATVPGGGTGNTTISAFCPVTGGGTNQAPLQTVSPAAAQPGYVLTYTGTPGNPTMPVWAASRSKPACSFLATNNVNYNNVCGNTAASGYTCRFDRIIVDTHNSFALPYFYYFPYKGYYCLYTAIRLSNLAGHSNVSFSGYSLENFKTNSFWGTGASSEFFFVNTWFQYGDPQSQGNRGTQCILSIFGGAKNINYLAGSYFGGHFAFERI